MNVDEIITKNIYEKDKKYKIHTRTGNECRKLNKTDKTK